LANQNRENGHMRTNVQIRMRGCQPVLAAATAFLIAATLSGCVSPYKKVAHRMLELRPQWETSVVHQASLPQRTVDWPQATALLLNNSLKLRRARVEVTNAQENVRQVFKDLLPQVNVRVGISQSIGELSMTTWDDLILDVNGFLNLPGLVNLNVRYFAAALILLRTRTLYELAQREQMIELYKLILAFEEHRDARADYESELRFANAVRTVDDMTGQVLLRDTESRELALIREDDALQERAGELLGDRRWRWVLSTNGMPSFNYESDPLPLADTNRIAQLQMRLVAIELVGAWARVVGIKLQYWPEMHLFVSGPPVYRHREGVDTFFDANEVRLVADVLWRLDTRGQVAKQLRQARRDQELQTARIRQESLALIDRILSAQRLIADLRAEVAELNQLIPVVESVPPTPDFAGIVKTAETRRSLRDRERRLRRDLAELNTLFWFVDEEKWRRENAVF
jgi:hypothetical protein